MFSYRDTLITVKLTYHGMRWSLFIYKLSTEMIDEASPYLDCLFTMGDALPVMTSLGGDHHSLVPSQTCKLVPGCPNENPGDLIGWTETHLPTDPARNRSALDSHQVLWVKRPADKNAIFKIACQAWLIWPTRVKGPKMQFWKLHFYPQVS